MSLILVGLNHRSAPVELRERLALPEPHQREIVGQLSVLPGVKGASFLSTCNRVEALLSCDQDEVIQGLVELLSGRASMDRSLLEQHLYVLRNRDVVRHLFRVAAGLDSMIVGEPQIHGQVRSAFHMAAELESLDPSLQRLYEQTLRVAKRVRTETGIGEHAVSVPYAAVELAKKIFGELRGLRVLVIGAGEMAELTAEHLHSAGVAQIFVANRAFERARELAERFSGSSVAFDAMLEKLSDADIVIASTAAPHHLVTRANAEAALAGRRRRSLFFIDLAVPRNLDPEIANVGGAYLYNIDDLQHVADANLERRLEKAEVAETIIEQEVDEFLRRLATNDAVPTIVELRDHLEQIRRSEVEKCMRRLGPVTTEQQEAIEQLSSAIINKILHYPILRIKESAADKRGEVESMRETIRRIFGLR